MPTPLFVGIDVSSKENVVCCLTDEEEKRPLCRFTVLNNRPGIIELQNRINQLVDKHNFNEIRFGLEHTGCYSTHAAIYLHRHLDFGCPDIKVFMFNPSLIKEFKKSNFLSAPKNDRVDAWYIAAKVRAGHLPHPFTWSEPMMALQRLTRARYHLMQTMVRESNFLMTNLYLKCSDYTLVFQNKLSATSLAVIEEFESKHWILSRVLVLSLPPVSWLKLVTSTSLTTINSWLSMQALPGQRTNRETLRLAKHGLFTPATAFYVIT